MIKKYIEVFSKNDLKMIYVCIIRERLIEFLLINLNNYYFYNSEDSEDYNIKFVKFLKFEKVKILDNFKDILEYVVIIYFDYKKIIVEDDGVYL